MTEKRTPKLRTVDKVKPPYPRNKFPANFGYKLGKEVVYLLATKGKPVLEGAEWEQIFASCISAKWKPSNVGLDDVVLGSCAWGAKTVKSSNPRNASTIRLISGRNSPVYSFNENTVTDVLPDPLGEKILTIWNERVSSIKKDYKHVRTIVLIKANDLSEVVIFEFDTIRYEPELYQWQWNPRRNLEGFNKSTGKHCFTWQPHGSQFTIVEDVPDDALLIKIKLPETLDKESVLQTIGFDKSWVQISKKDG